MGHLANETSVKRLFPFLLSGVCAVLLSLSASADDSYIAILGGSAQYFGEHQTIQMLEEYVKLSVSSKTYTVNARFVFYNNGVSTTVAVGFPAMLTGRSDPWQDFDSFKTWVNGNAVAFTDFPPDHAKHIVYDEVLGNPVGENYYKMKQVTFPAFSTTTTSVEYVAQLGGRAPNIKWAEYIFGTGRTWHGPIGKAIIEIDFDEDSIISSYDHADFFLVDNAASKIIHRATGQIVFELDNFKPANKTDGIQIDFTYLGDFVLDCPTPGAVCDRSQLQFSDDFRKSDLRKLSLAQLKLIRNEIYAVHGLKFKAPYLRSAFSGMPWYVPTKEQKDITLSEEEMAEVKHLAALEDSIKEAPRYKLPD